MPGWYVAVRLLNFQRLHLRRVQLMDDDIEALIRIRGGVRVQCGQVKAMTYHEKPVLQVFHVT
jgi:hypothetical protein